MRRAQARILEKSMVTIAEIAARLGIDFVSSVVQISGVATIFTSHSLGTNEIQLNHTRSMLLPDLELQYGQALAVLPVIQQKYSNTDLTF
jgi:hypothetical protein